MFKPVGFGVLISPVDLEKERQAKSDSRIIIPEPVKDKQRVETVVGIVLDYGEQAWADLANGRRWCKKGDKVLYAQYGGKIYKHPVTGQDLVLVQDRDILGIMEETRVE